jgi:AraC-like DNA-binding protein
MSLRYREAWADPGTGLRPVFIGIGTIDADAPGTYPAHRHQHYELIVPRRGAYRCRLNGEDLAIPATECLLVIPGDEHEDRIAAGAAHIGLWFALAGASLLAPTAPRRIRRTRELDAALTALLAESGDDPLAIHAREAHAALCVWRLVQALPPEHRAPAFAGASDDEAFRAELQRLFERHADRALTLGQMSTLLRCAERTLTARCRKLLGTSPHQAFLAVRLERARSLLAGTELPIKAVAKACGFADQFHFSRAYKARFGDAPSAAREVASAAGGHSHRINGV